MQNQKQKLKITDTTFRDAHQSLLATRLRGEDMMPIAADMDNIGFQSMEVWGGATFDAATRFLAEDPWHRLRELKKLMPNTPLQMLLRGQSLVGYRNYADDVVDTFIHHAADVGIDIFRVFDALNDELNLMTSAKAVKSSGKHLQMTICYSLTEEGRMGGDIYNLDYYLERAAVFQSMGADSICIKDMAGILAPYDAFELISALKESCDLPIQLHTHYTSGMASMSCLKAIEAGVDAVDACLAPLALRTAQPAVESLIIALRDGKYDTGLDLEDLIKLGDYLESVLPKYKQYMDTSRIAPIDTRVLSHQIPGGMISNLTSQLKQMSAIEHLPKVLDEIPQTRKEMGYPPLVTPISQMIGSQAVSNVLSGRYKIVSEEIKNYVLGLYGRPPTSLDSEIVKLITKDVKIQTSTANHRPSETLEPEIPKAKNALKDLSTEVDDILTYCLYPITGMRFLRMKYGLEPIPEDMKAGTLKNITEQKIQSDPLAISSQRTKSAKTRAFNIHVNDKSYVVEVDPITPPKQTAGFTAHKPSNERTLPKEDFSKEIPMLAPMPGLLSSYNAGVGQKVRKGDPIIILESMKMENTLKAPIDGVVKTLPLEIGATVDKDDILVIISPE